MKRLDRPRVLHVHVTVVVLLVCVYVCVCVCVCVHVCVKRDRCKVLGVKREVGTGFGLRV